MLVLARRQGEQIEVTVPGLDEPILITAIEVTPGKVRLGFDAPRNVAIDRGEIAEAKRREQRARRKGGAA
jgi:carbon storage regulator CsrA